jgi:hypothetical protein
MAETVPKRRAPKTRTRKTETQRLAAHRAYCATSEDRKRVAGLERLTIWIPSKLRGHFKTLAADACDSHLRCADPRAKAPVFPGIIPELTKDVGNAPIPTAVVATTAPKTPRNKKAQQDPRQLSLFEAPTEQEGARDGKGR